MAKSSETDLSPAAIRWADRRILSAAGRSPEPIAALLARHKLGRPSDAAIYQWISRGHIANAWRPALIFACLAEGRLRQQQVFDLGES